MARTKTLDMDKFKKTLGKHSEGHADFKERIKSAIDSGEHKSAEAAIKLLTKSRDSLHKMLEHVEGHMAKKKPASDMTSKTK